MPPPGTRLHLQGSTLSAIPSVHYRVPFAFEVNRRFCGSEETPDAVAVELGDQAAQAARRWIGELCGARDRPEPLPVMLGLARKNTRVRASRKEEARRLQKETGVELIDLPPEILRERLGFNGEHALFLSPTDSIIEAIRCSWEHDVPLFGVDLDEVADDVRGRYVIADPWLTEDEVPRYLEEHQETAGQCFDPDTDPRRELAMAARLKAVLQQYRNVLFVCGLAHWARLRALLLDPALKPAVLHPRGAPSRENGLRRVIVHPALAVVALDLWPALARLYESRRATGRQKSPPAFISRDEARDLLSRQLQSAYRRYWDEEKPAALGPRRAAELELVMLFERYVQSLCLVSGRCLPDLALLLSGARGVMSPAFVEQLGRVLMDFPWANPKQFPYPVLTPRCDSGGGVLCSFEGEKTFAGTEPFYVRTVLPPHGTAVRLGDWWSRSLPRHWLDGLRHYGRHTWGPWDYLASGLSIRALRLACRVDLATVSEAFVGGHLHRVDLKATLRSFVRGEDGVFVLNSVRRRRADPLQVVDFDPVVWILSDNPDARARWSVYSVSMAGLARYARDESAFAAARERFEDTVVCLLGYGPELDRGELRVRDERVAGQKFEGFVLFQPICWKLAQFARWLESTHFGRNPFAHSADQLFDSLPEPLQKLAGLGREDDWRSALIVMAIPFARSRVVFVSQGDYTPPSGVVAAARERGIELFHVSRGLFEASHVERLKWNYLTPLQQLEPDFAYPEWAEQAIGESQYLYRDHMPDEWLHFGEDL